jgi:hypothetical protein
LLASFVGGLLSASVLQLLPQVVAGNLSDQKIAASAFYLVDAKDRHRATLAVDGNGNPMLTMFDVNSKLRVALGITTDGIPNITLYDSRTKAGITLEMQSANPGICILDANGISRAMLGLTPDGSSALVLSDGAGRARTLAATLSDGSGTFEIVDRSRRPVFRAP